MNEWMDGWTDGWIAVAQASDIKSGLHKKNFPQILM